jgi:hypothetical protein
MNKDDHFTELEIQQRLQKTLRGAFTGPPTPLKDIPTSEGDSRKLRRTSGASASTAKTASRRKKDRA